MGVWYARREGAWPEGAWAVDTTFTEAQITSFFPTFLAFEARAKIGTMVMAPCDVRGVPEGTRGRVMGMEEEPSGGYELRILWLAEELPGRKTPFIEWFTKNEYERLLAETT